MIDLKRMLYRQLGIDMACSEEDVISRENVYTTAEWTEGMRKNLVFRDIPMHMIACNGKLLARCQDKELTAWLNLNYGDFPGEWLSEFSHLRQLDEKLGMFGLTIEEVKLYFIPGDPWLPGSSEKLKPVLRKPLKDYIINWFEGEEIRRFQGDDRFHEAVLFDERTPDVIAVTASAEGEIRAMAGATSDASNLWQIGIDVTSGSEGQGLGTLLVRLLKEEILRREILPFYGTAMSHIVSQRIAVRAGFVPAFSELTTRRLVSSDIERYDRYKDEPKLQQQQQQQQLHLQ